jgi:hypothetical protein
MRNLVIRQADKEQGNKSLFTSLPLSSLSESGRRLEALLEQGQRAEGKNKKAFPIEDYLREVLAEVGNPKGAGSYFFLVDSLIGIGRHNPVPASIGQELLEQLERFEARKKDKSEPGLEVLAGYGNPGSDIPNDEIRYVKLHPVRKGLLKAARRLEKSNREIIWKMGLYNLNRRAAYRAARVRKSLRDSGDYLLERINYEPLRKRTVDPDSGITHEERGGGFGRLLAKGMMGILLLGNLSHRGLNTLINAGLDGCYRMHNEWLGEALSKNQSILGNATTYYAGQAELYLNAYGGLARERLLVPLVQMQRVAEALPKAAGKSDLKWLHESLTDFCKSKPVFDRRITRRIDELVRRMEHIDEDISIGKEFSEVCELMDLEKKLSVSLVSYNSPSDYPSNLPELPNTGELCERLKITKLQRVKNRRVPRTRLYTRLSELSRVGYVRLLDKVSRFNKENDNNVLGESGKEESSWRPVKTAFAGLHELPLLLAEGLAAYESYVNMQQYAALAIRQRLDELAVEGAGASITETIVSDTLGRLEAERRESYRYVRALLPSLLPVLKNYLAVVNGYGKSVRTAGFQN